MTDAARDLAATWGRRIRETRRRAELTVVEVAKRAGINRTYLHDIEAGVYTPSDDVRVRLADALGVEVAAIFTYDVREPVT